MVIATEAAMTKTRITKAAAAVLPEAPAQAKAEAGSVIPKAMPRQAVIAMTIKVAVLRAAHVMTMIIVHRVVVVTAAAVMKAMKIMTIIHLPPRAGAARVAVAAMGDGLVMKKAIVKQRSVAGNRVTVANVPVAADLRATIECERRERERDRFSLPLRSAHRAERIRSRFLARING